MNGPMRCKVMTGGVGN